MIRILALNEVPNVGDVTQPSAEIATNEAQEEEAFSLYNKALSFQRLEDHENAEKTFKDLLKTKLIVQASSLALEENGLVHPGLGLKYSAHKNLGSMAAQREDYASAMEYLLEAVLLDSSDVTLWYKIGSVALKLHHYPLARNAFEQGLKCSSNHWLCLDKVITVLYALNDYNNCLHYISQALERDSSYVKALAIRDQIFQEHAALRARSTDLFKLCDRSIHTEIYDKDEAEKLIQEALEMREKKREISLPTPKPVLALTKPLTSYTWKCLGECFISQYDFVKASDPPITLTCHVDLLPYANIIMEENLPEVVPVVAPPPSLPVINSIPSSQAEPETVTMQLPPVVSEFHPDWYLPSDIVIADGEDTHMGPGRKGCKRKRIPVDPDLACKRRSARVRNTNKKKQGNVNYQELLQKFLPSSLLASDKTDDDSNVSSLHPEPDKIAENLTDAVIDASPLRVNSEKETVSSTEKEDVHEFIKNQLDNTGLISLMYHYIVQLSNKDHLKWPVGLADIFVNVYTRLRKHITEPSLFCRDLDDDEIKEMALMFLVSNELKMDKWQSTSKTRTSVSPNGSPRNTAFSTMMLGPDFPGKYFDMDLSFLVRLTIWQDILGEDWLKYSIRVFWLKSRYLMLIARMDLAVDCFDRITTWLSDALEEHGKEVIIKLPNCLLDNVITLGQVKKQMESLQRCQSLEEVHRLYELGEYLNVVDLLLQTFHHQSHSKEVMEGNIPERHAQLLLLQDSLWKLENHQQSLYWGEMSFNESLQQYVSTAGHSNKQDWMITMTQLLSGLDRLLAKDINIIKTLPSRRLARLTQNLIKVISLSMDSPDTSTEMAIPTLLPWILLYRLIEHEESTIRALAMKAKKESNPVTDMDTKVENAVFDVGMPSSLMLLYTAHEYLGRHSWCCNSDGALLIFYMDVLLKELKRSMSSSPHPYKEDLDNSIEQCFYCLYGHPNKKTKARHLQEHNAPQIILTWEKAVPLFEYFKPSSVPEFDSYKTNTVSGELENLLRRISLLVPDQENPPNTFESVTAYIEGQTNQPPCIPEDKPVTLPVVKELYYLLADYYFKNKEQGKSIKFYILDICFNPERFDSWAAMALARSSRLEQKMNSCELKSDGPIYKQSSAALRCFKRALELDGTNTSLWIEYGSLAYQIHSHASRQLKQHIQFGLNTEMMQMLKNKRQEMLQTAKQCFLSANQCEGDVEEEQWLHHYMLGKIAEKMGSAPQVYLEHYSKAAYHLHEDKARYPKKIHYHNPPDLAMEALEVYYRTHTSILKYLQSHLTGVDYDLLEKFIKVAADGPFANFREKEMETEREQNQNSFDVEMAFVPSTAIPVPVIGKKKDSSLYTATPTDHDYLRHLSKESSSKSDAESSIDLAEVWTKRIPGSELSDSQDKQVKQVMQAIIIEVAEKLQKEGSDGAAVIESSRIEEVPIKPIPETSIIDPKDILESVVNQEEQMPGEIVSEELKKLKTTDFQEKYLSAAAVTEVQTSMPASEMSDNVIDESKLVMTVAVDKPTEEKPESKPVISVVIDKPAEKSHESKLVMSVEVDKPLKENTEMAPLMSVSFDKPLEKKTPESTSLLNIEVSKPLEEKPKSTSIMIIEIDKSFEENPDCMSLMSVAVDKALEENIESTPLLSLAIDKTEKNPESTSLMTVAVNKPLEEKTESSPLMTVSINKPLKENSECTPMMNMAVDKLLKENTECNPMMSMAVDKPLTGNLESIPLISVAVDKPLKENLESIPLINLAVDKPVKENIENTPLISVAVDKSIKENIVNTPLISVAVDKPLKENLESTPLISVAFDEPLKENLESTPLISVAVDKPLKENLESTPLISVAVDKPLKEKPESTPLISVAVDKPLTGIPESTTLIRVAVDKPLKENLENTPLISVAVDKPLKENPESTPLISVAVDKPLKENIASTPLISVAVDKSIENQSYTVENPVTHRETFLSLTVSEQLESTINSLEPLDILVIIEDDPVVVKEPAKESSQDLAIAAISTEEPNYAPASLVETGDPNLFKDIGIIKWAMVEDYENNKTKSPRSRTSSTDQSPAGQMSPRFPGVDKKRIVFELEEMVVIRNEDSDKDNDSLPSCEIDLPTQPIGSPIPAVLQKPHLGDSSSDSSLDSLSSINFDDSSEDDSSSVSSSSSSSLSKKFESNKKLPKTSDSLLKTYLLPEIPYRQRKGAAASTRLNVARQKLKETEVVMIDLTLDSSEDEPPKVIEKVTSSSQIVSKMPEVKTVEKPSSDKSLSDKNQMADKAKQIDECEKKKENEIAKKVEIHIENNNVENPKESTTPLTKEEENKKPELAQNISVVAKPSEEKIEAVAKKLESGNEIPAKRRKTEDEVEISLRHIMLMKKCIHSLDVCLLRFPQHYKSLYRLAFCYFNFAKLKNEQWARDLMLGTVSPWQNYVHMPCQGLFQERKQANFFNGIWRIPIEEIDRPGSFASHMYRSIVILLDILNATNDSTTLYQVAVQLLRNPDQGNDLKNSWLSYYHRRKYLRDMDRTYLAKQAFHLSLLALHNQTDQLRLEKDFEKRLKVLLEVYRVWQQAIKLNIAVDQVNELLTAMYKICRKEKAGAAKMDVIIRYCQFHEKKASQIHEVVRSTPTTPTSPSLSNPTHLSIDRMGLATSGIELSKQRRSNGPDGVGTSEVYMNVVSEGPKSIRLNPRKERHREMKSTSNILSSGNSYRRSYLDKHSRSPDFLHPSKLTADIQSKISSLEPTDIPEGLGQRLQFSFENLVSSNLTGQAITPPNPLLFYPNASFLMPPVSSQATSLAWGPIINPYSCLSSQTSLLQPSLTQFYSKAESDVLSSIDLSQMSSFLSATPTPDSFSPVKLVKPCFVQLESLKLQPSSPPGVLGGQVSDETKLRLKSTIQNRTDIIGKSGETEFPNLDPAKPI